MIKQHKNIYNVTKKTVKKRNGGWQTKGDFLFQKRLNFTLHFTSDVKSRFV